MIASNDGGMVVCMGLREIRIEELRLAMRSIQQSVVVLGQSTGRVQAGKERIAELLSELKNLNCDEYTVARGDFTDLDIEPHEEYIPPVQVYSPAILVHRKHQTHREAFKGVSGCPPINRGRHWDRKFKATKGST